MTFNADEVSSSLMVEETVRSRLSRKRSIPGALLATEFDIGQEIQHVLVQESQVLNVVQRARAGAVVEAVQARVDLSDLRT